MQAASSFHRQHRKCPSQTPSSCLFWQMIQMDASLHHWFGNVKSQLHIAIDDCTGQIVGAFFDSQETLNGYYHVFYQILTTYGIPAMFYTDRRTVLEYKKKHSESRKGFPDITATPANRITTGRHQQHKRSKCISELLHKKIQREIRSYNT